MIDVCWENDSKTIIRQDYTKYWNWEEYMEAMATTHEMLDSINNSVDIIMNMGEDGMLPWEAFCAGHCFPQLDIHPNQRTKIAITSSSFKQFANLFNRLYPDKARNIQLYIAEDMLEAYEIIEDQRIVKS